MKRQGQTYNPQPAKSPGFLVKGRQVAAFLLASSIASLQVGAWAQVLDTAARPVRGQISISRAVGITSSNEKVSLSLRNADVKDVLQMLAKQGKFNIMLDESVTGTLTVDINNVSINKALEYVFTMMDLSYMKDGNTVMVATKETAEQKSLTVRSLKTIPVQYKSAVNIANQLNNTIFKVPRASGNTIAVAAADPDSNSLLVMGTETDMKLVGDALRELDVPRNRKVYHIRHNQPADVARVLAANFFQNNASVTINTAGNSTGSSTSTTGGSSTSSTTTSSSTSSTSTSGSSGSTTGSTSGTSGSTTGSSTTSGGTTGSTTSTSTSSNTGVTVTSFTSDGVTFISEPVSATLTVLATEEQLGLIDSVIDQIDVQRAQVAIEVALVEIQNSDKKAFLPTWGTLSSGNGFLTLNPLRTGGANTFVIQNPFSVNGLRFPTSVKTSGVGITHQNKNIRSKVLANPTLVTIDGQNASISITDSVANITATQTITGNGNVQTTLNVTQSQAGVTLSLTPKVYNDGSIVMTSLSPTVTQPTGQIVADQTQVTLLSTRSMTLSGVRVKDGETLVVGGLLKEAQQLDINKVPGLDKMPILGAMFRAVNSNNKDKTELVLMVTPHILKEDNVTYFRNANNGKYANMNYGRGGIVPVSLPKFMGGNPEESTPGGGAPNESGPAPAGASSGLPSNLKKAGDVSMSGQIPAVDYSGKNVRIDLGSAEKTDVSTDSSIAKPAPKKAKYREKAHQN